MPHHQGIVTPIQPLEEPLDVFFLGVVQAGGVDRLATVQRMARYLFRRPMELLFTPRSDENLPCQFPLAQSIFRTTHALFVKRETARREGGGGGGGGGGIHNNYLMHQG